MNHRRSCASGSRLHLAPVNNNAITSSSCIHVGWTNLLSILIELELEALIWFLSLSVVTFCSSLETGFALLLNDSQYRSLLFMHVLLMDLSRITTIPNHHKFLLCFHSIAPAEAAKMLCKKNT